MCGAKNIEELSFKAERGIGQGESASSMQWTVLYDMVLESIDPKNKKLHKDESLQEYINEIARDAALYAYADDLATCSAGPQAEYTQQLQAKWLCTFCAFSGLMIYAGKIKATIVGNKRDQRHDPQTKPDGTKYCPSTLTVYDHQWEPTECPIDPTLTTYKDLGVHLALRCKNNDAFDRRQKTKAAAMLSHLLTQARPQQAKIGYIRFKIMPIILYMAQVSNWSLKQYCSLNALFTENYQKLLSLLKKSPEAIKYLLNKYNGIGLLKKVSDLAQEYK
jgi:hypothetical protein